MILFASVTLKIPVVGHLHGLKIKCFSPGSNEIFPQPIKDWTKKKKEGKKKSIHSGFTF